MPVRISTRPRGREASTISSTIYANRSPQTGSHAAFYVTNRKVVALHRLRDVGRFARFVEHRGRDQGPLVVLAELAGHMDRVSDLDRLCIA
jgi:hypothetical protein